MLINNIYKFVSFLLLSVFVVLITPNSTLAWDAGTESRRHIEGTGGENSISILDTRPKWAKSVQPNTSRVSDCPSGYKNTGATCLRDADSIHAPSRLGDCPSGYTNTLVSCYRGPDTYSKKCTIPVFGPKYSCKSGYTDNGCTCGRGADTISRSNMTCPGGYHKSPILPERCIVDCPSGYTNTGETCYRGPDTISKANMSCSSNETEYKILGITRCYENPICPAGYEIWNTLCYIKPPKNAKRTAVSTVVHDVKQSGNTHLYIVNRALELLDKSGDSDAKKIADLMNQKEIRTEWENGLWDGDSEDYVDYPDHMGTHFYNAALKDRGGDTTTEETYGGVANISWSNKFDCKNARECAKFQLDKINKTLDKDNAKHLGLALHYMTDSTQPMHTSGWSGSSIPMQGHPHYEYYAAFIQGNHGVGQINWDKRWKTKSSDEVIYETALKSNTFAKPLTKVLHVTADAGVCTMQGFNGIDAYTGYCFYNDPEVEELTGKILQEAYQSTASYLYAFSKTLNAVNAPGLSSTSASTTVPALTDSAINSKVSNYYNQKSEWAGQYSLAQVIRSRTVNVNAKEKIVHVEYSYQAVNGGQTGTDKRTFTFKYVNQWDLVSMGANQSASFNNSTTSTTVPALTDSTINSKVSNHYNQKSEWAGQYVIVRVIRSRTVNVNAKEKIVHVEYQYRGKTNTQTGVDKRTFTFKYVNQWDVVSMGANQSASF